MSTDLKRRNVPFSSPDMTEDALAGVSGVSEVQKVSGL